MGLCASSDQQAGTAGQPEQPKQPETSDVESKQSMPIDIVTTENETYPDIKSDTSGGEQEKPVKPEEKTPDIETPKTGGTKKTDQAVGNLSPQGSTDKEAGSSDKKAAGNLLGAGLPEEPRSSQKPRSSHLERMLSATNITYKTGSSKDFNQKTVKQLHKEKYLTDEEYDKVKRIMAAQIQPHIATYKAITEELNRVRTDPSGYADYLAAQDPNPMEPGARDEAVEVLRGTKPLGELQLDLMMCHAPQNFVERTGPLGAAGMNPADSSPQAIAERLNRYGQWQPTGECQALQLKDAKGIVRQLIEGARPGGAQSRPYRNCILGQGGMAKPGFVGIGVGPHKDYGWMCVLDFTRGNHY